jgi:predicted nucleic acid-binding protein
MVVVADSSPLHYLILIDVVQTLPELFGEVLIPEAVFRELQNPGTPSVVANWLSHRPAWLRVERVAESLQDERLNKLGEGERDAIALSLARGLDVLLLIDEGRGRREAALRQIPFMGMLGVLDRAAARGLLDLPAAVERLLQTNFRIAPHLLKTLLDDDTQRKQSSHL